MSPFLSGGLYAPYRCGPRWTCMCRYEFSVCISCTAAKLFVCKSLSVVAIPAPRPWITHQMARLWQREVALFNTPHGEQRLLKCKESFDASSLPKRLNFGEMTEKSSNIHKKDYFDHIQVMRERKTEINQAFWGLMLISCGRRHWWI